MDNLTSRNKKYWCAWNCTQRLQKPNRLDSWSNESICANVYVKRAVVIELLPLPAHTLLSTSALIRVATEFLPQSACSRMALACLSPLFPMSVKNWRGDAFSLSHLFSPPPSVPSSVVMCDELSEKSKYWAAGLYLSVWGEGWGGVFT